MADVGGVRKTGEGDSLRQVRARSRFGGWGGRVSGLVASCAVASALLGAPSPAEGGCRFVDGLPLGPGNNRVEYFPDGFNESIWISHWPDGRFVSRGETCTGGISGATTATVRNVDQVQAVPNHPGYGNVFGVSQQTLEHFRPGQTAESDGASEIEFEFRLGGGIDEVAWAFSPEIDDPPLYVRLGSENGRDLLDVDAAPGKASEPEGFFYSVELATVLVNNESALDTTGDVIDGRGGFGLGALSSSLYVQADRGDDRIYGGSGPDILMGALGNDLVMGGPGDDALNRDDAAPWGDSLYGDAGDDAIHFSRSTLLVDGGPGVDVVDAATYEPVTVDLRSDEAVWARDDGQTRLALTSIEGAIGSNHDDVLLGDEGANRFIAGTGMDTLRGFGGDDVLVAYRPRNPNAESLSDDIAGGDGDDVVDVRDRGRDHVECGAGTDAVTADEASLDTIASDCERVDAPGLPVPPVIQNTLPSSPANDNNPAIVGDSHGGTVVKLYSRPDCTGQPLASGTATEFRSPGLPISVEDDTQTRVRATATNATGYVSGCSSGFIYYEDSTPPEAPLLRESSPRSPASQNHPRIKGWVPAGDLSAQRVAVYQTSGCTGAAAGAGPASALMDVGIPVSVPDNSTSLLRAAAIDLAGNVSPCSAAYRYIEDSRSPRVRILNKKGRIRDRTPVWHLHANEPTRFRCQLDSRRWQTCHRRYTVPKRLRAGTHDFSVRGSDLAGNQDSSRVVDHFRVTPRSK